MVLHVLAIGKVRDANLRASCEDYLARARRYFRIDVREVTPRTAGATRGQKLRAEAAALLGAVPPASAVAVLTRSGRSADSPRFAERIQEWRRDARDVAFVIGGAFGVDDTVLERASAQISLSPLTLPHELARLVLFEQLYRAGTILKGEPYHKGRG